MATGLKLLAAKRDPLNSNPFALRRQLQLRLRRLRHLRGLGGLVCLGGLGGLIALPSLQRILRPHLLGMWWTRNGWEAGAILLWVGMVG